MQRGGEIGQAPPMVVYTQERLCRHPWDRVTAAAWCKFTDLASRIALSHITDVHTLHRRLRLRHGPPPRRALHHGVVFLQSFHLSAGTSDASAQIGQSGGSNSVIAISMANYSSDKGCFRGANSNNYTQCTVPVAFQTTKYSAVCTHRKPKAKFVTT